MVKSLSHKDEMEKLSILEAIPSFMIDRLLPVMNLDFLKSNINFMNGLENTIEITTRVNTLARKQNHEVLLRKIEENLKMDKIKYRKDPDISNLLWIPLSQKNKVVRNSFYQEGSLIFQDKASVAVIETF